MGVDVVDAVARDARVLDGAGHREDGALGLRVDVRDPIGVRRVAVAEELAEDRDAALAGVCEVFEDERAGPFGDDEAAALAIERAGRRRRRGVPLGQGLEENEPGESQRT